MCAHRIKTRPARGKISGSVPLLTDTETVSGFLEDAAHYPGGHASQVAQPRSESEITTLLQQAQRVLPIGAQSSLTGGATPMGDLVLSTSKLNSIVQIQPDAVRVQAGVPLMLLQERLAEEGLYYPPVPTFSGAFSGGVAATNASGATTFKYGSTRTWVRELTVILATGDVLDITRGEVEAHPDGYFEIETLYNKTRVPVPLYEMPKLLKHSAGYFAMPGMDLIDLFIGSEGTLGIISEVTFKVLPKLPTTCWAIVPIFNEQEAIKLVTQLRIDSQKTWKSNDPCGMNVSAIEYMDRRCIQLLRENESDRRNNLSFQTGTEVVLLIQLELPTGALTNPDQWYQEIASALSEDAPDTGLVRLCRAFAEADVLDRTELVLPNDRRRADQLLAIREAVPAAVNQKVKQAKQTIDPLIEKIAADMTVPFTRFAESLQIYRDGFEKRELDYAIWGHISDGNVHPNVIPHSIEDMQKGKEAILEFGRKIIELGGSPLAEHGVGRNPVKQALLQQLYGKEGIEQMRQVKEALDPENKLSPGVLLPKRSTMAR